MGFVKKISRIRKFHLQIFPPEIAQSWKMAQPLMMKSPNRIQRVAHCFKSLGYSFPEHLETQDPLRYWQARVLHTLFLTSVILGFLALVPSVWLSIREKLYAVALFDIVVYGFLFVLFLRKTFDYTLRATAISVIVYLVGLLLFVTLGPSGTGPIWLFAFPVITGVLLGFNAAIIALSLNGFTLSIVGILLFQGYLAWEYPVVNPIGKWVVIFFNFMLLNTLATVSLTSILKGLQAALGQEKILSSSLKQKHTELMNSHQELQKEILKKELVLKELKESDRKVLLLAENALDCIWRMDPDLRFTYVNPIVKTLFGFAPDECLGTRLTDHSPPEEKENILKRINEELHRPSDGPGILFETRVRHRNGHFIPVEILMKQLTEGDGGIIGLQGTTRDIRERKSQEDRRLELENQVQRAQKLESIGTLAGGIAHDFNNILTAVIGYTELALLKVKKQISAEDELNDVYRAGIRAKELVKQILAFSRKGLQEKKPVQVGFLAKEVVKLIRSTIPTTIEIKSSITSTSLVMADPTQIHQVLMNLCTNAAQAMEEKEGTLAVEMTEVEPERSLREQYPDLKDSKYLKVRVSDTGAGIDPSVVGSIFEPYFTTKEPGSGTGLGLSVAHGIIKAHGGEITVESELGKGSTFTVYLPALKRQIEEASVVVEQISTGRERILLVDDEGPIVEMGIKMLSSLGYNVTGAASSSTALDLLRNSPAGFDLVITDMNMPKMAGDRLSTELLKIRPNIPIILCTGYSSKMSRERALNLGIRGFIMKPYITNQLARTVRSVLDEVSESE